MKKTILTIILMLPMVLMAQKFGYLNSQELFVLMPEMADIQQKMDTLQSMYENQLTNMQEEYYKKVEDFQKNMASMTDGVKEFRQNEISEMEQRIQLFHQTALQDIKKKQEEYFLPVQEKLQKAIEKVGQSEGYTYIFSAAALLYAAPDAVDVGPIVRKELKIAPNAKPILPNTATQR